MARTILLSENIPVPRDGVVERLQVQLSQHDKKYDKGGKLECEFYRFYILKAIYDYSPLNYVSFGDSDSIGYVEYTPTNLGNEDGRHTIKISGQLSFEETIKVINLIKEEIKKGDHIR